MHDLANQVPPPSIKGDSFAAANWRFRDKEFSMYDIQFYIKDRLSLYVQN